MWQPPISSLEELLNCFLNSQLQWWRVDADPSFSSTVVLPFLFITAILGVCFWFLWVLTLKWMPHFCVPLNTWICWDEIGIPKGRYSSKHQNELHQTPILLEGGNLWAWPEWMGLQWIPETKGCFLWKGIWFCHPKSVYFDARQQRVQILTEVSVLIVYGKGSKTVSFEAARIAMVKISRPCVIYLV